jgi:xanthine/CO dehydrogenase XdhC/CoxF family maturation factor/CTP:molybdopterin cytidylyltransferase MocA
VRHFYHTLIGELENKRRPVLATVLATRGSAPQVPGASALFSGRGLLSGTLGGGILEGDATRKAMQIHGKRTSLVYTFGLDADFSSSEGAICGGSATILLDADPGRSLQVFRELEKSIGNGIPGVLLTRITGSDKIEIKRQWFASGDPDLKPKGHPDEHPASAEWKNLWAEMDACLAEGKCTYRQRSDAPAVFLEPVRPLPKLLIAGAGHIGRALAHLGNLLDFEVTVLDDRKEYANARNIADADRLIVEPVGKAMQEIRPGPDTHVVIVTRGHRDDTEALRACISWDVPYIGMIGSRKKIRTMRENFLSHDWATASQFDRVYAPVGLEIGSKTVQEIAVSIAAQLIQARNDSKKSYPGNPPKARHISAIILAAGESSRMKKPKLLLPFGDRSIIETVVDHAGRSAIGKTIVVLGANHEAIGKQIRNYPVETVYNSQYKKGMFSSVQCGLRAVPEPTEAVMILLGDQPMIGTGIMDRMVKAYRKAESGIIVASCKGKRGHPILIGSKYFRELLELPSGSSLRELLDMHLEDITELETDSPEILRDIDTEKDYQEELKHHHKTQTPS